jgi:hypothetical protein
LSSKARVGDAFVQRALRAGHPVWLRARGQSMRPLIPDGSEVLVVPLERPPRVGEVVLLEVLGEVALHRVVEVSLAAGRRYVRSRGDGRRLPDPPLPAEAVLGRAARVRLGRHTVRLDSRLAMALGWAVARLFPYLWWLRR